MPRNLTPVHLRCQWGACPAIHELDDGSLLIVGKSATMAAALERVSVGEDEHAVIVDRELVANVPPVWRTIGSAPRDGTMILAFIKGTPPLMLPVHWRDGRWWDDIGRGFGGTVTHWLPLPLPPAEKVEA